MNKQIPTWLGIAAVAVVGMSLVCAGSAQAAKKSWKRVGKLGFSAGTADNISFAFNPKTKKPYVTFLDSQNSYKVTVMKFNGKKWQYVGDAFNPSLTGSVDLAPLAFHPSTGEPYVAYKDDANSGKLSVKKFNGSSWETVGAAGFTQGVGAAPFLAFNPSTRELYVAFKDFTNGGNDVKISVMKFNGTWLYVGAFGFGDSSGDDAPPIFFDASNQPYVAFSDWQREEKATVMKFDGIQWVNVGSPGFSSGSAVSISLALNPATNQPYVSYIDYGNDRKLTVMKFDGSQWLVVGASPGFTSSSVLYPSLAFNPKNNQPYVAFRYDASRPYQGVTMNYDGTRWKAVGKSFSPQGADYVHLLFQLGSKTPYVAYGDLGRGGKVSVKKYSK